MLMSKGKDAIKNVIWKLENIYNCIYLKNTFVQYDSVKRSVKTKNEEDLESHTYGLSQKFLKFTKNVMLRIKSSSNENEKNNLHEKWKIFSEMVSKLKKLEMFVMH